METGAIFADEITERINNDHENVRALLEWVSDRLLAADPTAPNAVDEISEFIESLLTATPYVHCIWFSFEPGSFLPDARFSIDYVKSDEGIVWHFDFDDDLLHDPELAPWYYIPFSTGEIWFETADLYDYEIGTGYMFTDTVSMPLIRDGEIIGVAGIDTLYVNQFRFVGEKDIENERLLLLLTQSGEIVYSSDNRFLTESIFDMPYGDDGRIKESLSSYELSIFEGISPFLGVRSVMSFNPVYAEHASQQLYLYIDMLTTTLFRPAADATGVIALLSTVGLILLSAILFYIIRSNLKPIKTLTENAKQLADGTYDADFSAQFGDAADAADSKNEMDLLSAALRKMLDQLQDAQELKLREQALIADIELLDRLNLIKTEFFQNMSHDFKTPLTVISVHVLDTIEMLRFGTDEKAMMANMETAQREIMRMGRMVDGAIKQSSLQDSRKDMKPIDIAALLRESVHTYSALLDRNGNALTLDAPDTLPLIPGNKDMLLHILSNLISNANRYTKDGKISVRASETGGAVTVTVRDSGMGIKPEMLPHIFDRGISDGGTGFGLSICKSAIEAHGGTISIKSEYGHGTEVTFTIPIQMNERSERTDYKNG